MKSYLGVIILFCVFQGRALTSAAMPVVLAVFDQHDKSEFEKRFLPVLAEQVKSCADCQIQNLTPYDDKGHFDPTHLVQQVESVGDRAQVVFVNWNERLGQHSKELLEAFRKASNKGVVIVAAAGAPTKESEESAPLSQTLFGKIPGTVIIGERSERDRLPPTSYFGPEMLTALRPRKEQMGQGYTPAIFAGKLACNWRKRNDWRDYLQAKKSKSRKIWLDLEDFF